MIGNIGKIKTSSNKSNRKIPYKIDTGSDGNSMPIHIFKLLFPGMTKENLVATEHKSVVQKYARKW